MPERTARTRSLVMVAVLAVMLAMPAPTLAIDEEMTADLDGTPIELVEVGDHDCHAFDLPAIHCYSTAEGLDDAIAEWFGVGRFSSTFYVMAYEDANYGGSRIALDYDVANFATIGWNDRISSMKSVGGGYGTFYQHSSYAGWSYWICCGSQVSYVGDTYNDQISSFDW